MGWEIVVTILVALAGIIAGFFSLGKSKGKDKAELAQYKADAKLRGKYEEIEEAHADDSFDDLIDKL